jgi:starvation-inducible DNA-binding protein
MSTTQLIDALHKSAGNVFETYKRTHIHHVNVEGPTFKQDHDFLGELYEQFNEIFDTIAELIRIEDSIFKYDFENLSVIPDDFSSSDRTKIFNDILMCIDLCVASLYSSHEIAVKMNSIGTFTTIETIIESLKKTRWMVKSSI